MYSYRTYAYIRTVHGNTIRIRIRIRLSPNVRNLATQPPRDLLSRDHHRHHHPAPAPAPTPTKPIANHRLLPCLSLPLSPPSPRSRTSTFPFPFLFPLFLFRLLQRLHQPPRRAPPLLQLHRLLARHAPRAHEHLQIHVSEAEGGGLGHESAEGRVGDAVFILIFIFRLGLGTTLLLLILVLVIFFLAFPLSQPPQQRQRQTIPIPRLQRLTRNDPNLQPPGRGLGLVLPFQQSRHPRQIRDTLVQLARPLDKVPVHDLRARDRRRHRVAVPVAPLRAAQAKVFDQIGDVPEAGPAQPELLFVEAAIFDAGDEVVEPFALEGVGEDDFDRPVTTTTSGRGR